MRDFFQKSRCFPSPLAHPSRACEVRVGTDREGYGCRAWAVPCCCCCRWRDVRFRSVRAGREAVAACRKRADHVFLTQNRGTLYAQDRYAASTRDAPISGIGLPVPNDSRLSAEHEYDEDVNNCLNGGEGLGIVSDQPPPPLKGDAAPVP